MAKNSNFSFIRTYDNENTKSPLAHELLSPSTVCSSVSTRQSQTHFPGDCPHGFLPRQGSPVSAFHPCAPSTCTLWSWSYHDGRLPTTTVLPRFSSLDIKKSCGKAATPGSTGQNLLLHNSGASNSMDIKRPGAPRWSPSNTQLRILRHHPL